MIQNVIGVCYMETQVGVSMSPPTYYLINHSQKEFCYFENDIPIFHILDAILEKYDHWSKNDDIVIDSQDACSSDLVEYLVNDAGYRDMNYDDDEDE